MQFCLVYNVSGSTTPPIISLAMLPTAGLELYYALIPRMFAEDLDSGRVRTFELSKSNGGGATNDWVRMRSVLERARVNRLPCMLMACHQNRAETLGGWRCL